MGRIRAAVLGIAALSLSTACAPGSATTLEVCRSYTAVLDAASSGGANGEISPAVRDRLLDASVTVDRYPDPLVAGAAPEIYALANEPIVTPIEMFTALGPIDALCAGNPVLRHAES